MRERRTETYNVIYDLMRWISLARNGNGFGPISHWSTLQHWPDHGTARGR